MHFIQPHICDDPVSNYVLLKISKHETNHKLTFIGQSKKKEKKKEKKPSMQKRRTRSTFAISTEFDLSCWLNTFKFSSYS